MSQEEQEGGSMHFVESKTPMGAFIRSRRLELNLSGIELAKKIGVSRSYISQLEIGLRNLIQSERLLNLAETLRVSPEELRALCKPRKIYKVVRRRNSVGFFLTEQRIRLGLSQSEVAKKAGLSSGNLSRLEKLRKKTKPHLKTLRGLVAVLGQDVLPKFLS